MITIDQPALDQQMRAFTESLRNKAAFLKVATNKVLKVETNRLCQTLINFTPPQKLGPAGKKIEEDVRYKLGLFGNVDESFPAKFHPPGPVSKTGLGETYWFLWNHKILMGAARVADMRNASPDDVYKMYWDTMLAGKSGREYMGHRGKQRIVVIKKRVFKQAQVRALISRLKKHLGRMKAGWLVGWRATGSGKGIYSPPEWVLKHESGAKGDADMSRSESGDVLELTITNTAKGIGSNYMRKIAHNALGVRIKAIPDRLVQIIKQTDPAKAQEMISKELA